jgi:hypothetical protein
VRRTTSAIAALIVALFVYGTILVLLFVRMTRVFIVCHFHGSAPPPPPPVVSVVGGQVHVFSVTVPLGVVIGTAAVPAVWWLTATLYDGRLRRDRERRGLCLECGGRLAGKRGRCPRCGERFERSLPHTSVEFATGQKSLSHR